MSKLNRPIERTMFTVQTDYFERAKALRQNPTKAENALWNILRKKQMLNLRFKQQHPIKFLLLTFIVMP